MKVILKSIVASLAVMSLAACSNNDLYDEGVVNANKTAEQMQSYEANFVKTYGAIAPTQSWDFSSNQQRLGTRGASEITSKLVDGLEFNPSYEIKVPLIGKPSIDYTNRKIDANKAIYDNVVKQLPDKKKHENVQKATLVAPVSSFTIYPISVQGSWTHDLYVKVGDAEPRLLYSKTWTDASRPYVNGEIISAEIVNNGSWLVPRYAYEVKEQARFYGLYVEAPIGTPIEIYLANVKNGNSAKPTVGTSTGNVIYVDGNGAKPEGIELVDDAVIKYVGIEDQLSGGDLDYNDVVLAIVGNPDVPEEIIIEEDEYNVPTSLTKRYMVEDLGTTDDFDFNDVVVDVTENTNTHHKVTFKNGVVETDIVTVTKSQKAVVKHLGGILPFVLKIGDTTLPELGGNTTFDTDVNLEYDITGWIPGQNNISISVNNTTLSFPKVGAVPMIIACDDDVEWSAERVAFDWKQFLEVK